MPRRLLLLAAIGIAAVVVFIPPAGSVIPPDGGGCTVTPFTPFEYPGAVVNARAAIRCGGSSFTISWRICVEGYYRWGLTSEWRELFDQNPYPGCTSGSATTTGVDVTVKGICSQLYYDYRTKVKVSFAGYPGATVTKWSATMGGKCKINPGS
jgi:hypothetical protein